MSSPLPDTAAATAADMATDTATDAAAATATAAPIPPCPECGSPLTADPRFVRWCTSCGWNVHPGGTDATTRADRFGRRLNRAAEERLFQRVTRAGDLRPTRDGAWLAAAGLATLVHLVTLGIGVTGAALIVLVPHGAPALAIGALLVLCAVGMRPRLGSMRSVRKRSISLTRDGAPTLYALADRIAAELGTPPLRLIRVDGRHNASYQRVGLRQRPVLTLGLPLWETLSPQQRVALLGHELGHGANGDTTHGLWVGSALRSLAAWYSVMTPATSLGRGRNIVTMVGGLVAKVVMFVFAEAVLLFHRLLLAVTVLGSRRAEYLADSMAARVAGSDATVGLLQQLTLGGAVGQVRHQRAFRGSRVPGRRGEPSAPVTPRADFWSDLRAYVGSIPETERARRLRVSELDDSATDATHPPTHLRLDFARQLPYPEPLVVPTPAELTAIEAELARSRAAVAERLDSPRL
jgi:Zn-dependent protease with chaperone function/predicted RNA-binding Zn-ribbon protein involved in translation (DUF1610 family)